MTLEGVRLSGFKMPCVYWRYSTRVPTDEERAYKIDLVVRSLYKVSDRRAAAKTRVYFIAGGDLIKIGVTGNLTERLKTLRSTSPVPLVLLGSIPGTLAEERFLHEAFAASYSHGEWFRRTDELTAFIKEYAA